MVQNCGAAVGLPRSSSVVARDWSVAEASELRGVGRYKYPLLFPSLNIRSEWDGDLVNSGNFCA